MTIWQLFKDALLHPKKHAAYRLLPIGKVIQYLFLLSTIITLISFTQFTLGFGEQTNSIEGLAQYIDGIEWLLYPLSLIFLFIMNTSLLFIRVSIYAAIGLLFIYFLHRRGEYRMLWRTATFSMTLGFLLSTILSFFNLTSLWISFISAIITLVYLYIALKKYPKQPKEKLIVPN
ncbi:MAG: DUF1189 family protein [Kurthia sp.]|nr:DUF1189 family protein [Candidatus Kurthia equi]